MEASSRSSAVALRAQDCRATPFETPETDKTFATRKIAVARKNALARASRLQTSNRESRLLCIFSTMSGFHCENQPKPADRPLSYAAKHFARLRDNGGIPRREDPSSQKREGFLSCRAESQYL